MEIYIALNLDDVSRGRLERLAEAGDVMHFAGMPAADAPRDARFAQSTVAFGNPPSGWLTPSEALRFVQLESVGFDAYTDLPWDKLAARLSVCNLAGFFAEPVAESCLAGVLALYRGVDRLVELKASRTWQGNALRPTLHLLQRARVLLLGRGAINQRIEDLLAPFGCSISALTSRSEASELDARLPNTDLLIATVPDTPRTRDLLNAKRLALLPQHARIANFGRGSLIDEQALATALHEGRLAGAVIDVTRNEPLPADDPLWQCPNTLLLQHTGGGSADELDRKIDVFARNLARFRRGEPLEGVIDLQKGY